MSPQNAIELSSTTADPGSTQSIICFNNANIVFGSIPTTLLSLYSVSTPQILNFILTLEIFRTSTAAPLNFYVTSFLPVPLVPSAIVVTHIFRSPIYP